MKHNKTNEQKQNNPNKLNNYEGTTTTKYKIKFRTKFKLL